MTPAATNEQAAPALLKDTATLLNRIEKDWRRMQPDLDSVPMLTGLLLDRLGSVFARHVEQTYSEEGINASNWDLLLTLMRSAPPQGLTYTELGELAAVSGPSMTNRVTRLLDKGLVERVINGKDRRSALVHLTPQGRELVERLLPQHIACEQQALSVLTDEELERLTGIAMKLVGHLEVDGVEVEAGAPVGT
jgi:DNA-binding MarR family transcriptional regulator